MPSKYQNIFIFVGLALLILMVVNLDFGEVWRGLQHAGYWFFAVLALWAVLYMMNTLSWMLILRHLAAQPDSSSQPERPSQPGRKLGFWWLYKITVSGFALNYATPGGLMGGEPYRIMELAPRIGTARASSAVILYAMTHIFSHLWFWLLSVALYLAIRPVNVLTGMILTAVTLFCVGGIWLFFAAYRNGLAVKVMSLLNHIPLIKKWVHPFIARNQDKLQAVDSQIASLHQSNKSTLVLAVLIELICRICSALEILFVLLVIMPSVNYLHCILILAFTSLFANMLFFMPLQIGGREGGFVMSATTLGISASSSIFLALIVRLRELVWTGIGLLLIKLGPGAPSDGVCALLDRKNSYSEQNHD